MGEYVNVCSGAAHGSLPASHVRALLYNVPGALRDEISIKNTQELIDEASPEVLFQDSGGFQIYQVIEKGLPIMFDPTKGVYHNGILNITPGHLMQAAKIFHPDVMIGLDYPIPRLTGPRDPAQQELLFLRFHGFNLRWAKDTARLRIRHCPETVLFLPIQAYTLRQLRWFLEDLGSTVRDGFSIPVRNHKPTEIALFLLQLHHYGVKRAHILGTFTFRTLALAAYFARNLYDFISLDCTMWRSDAEYSLYYLPHDLRKVRLLDAHELNELVEITCSCPWCRGKTFTEIKNMPYPARHAFLRRHNYWVIEEAMGDFYDNAETADSLKMYLHRVSGRKSEIQEICGFLQQVEIIRHCLSDDAIEILSNLLT